MTENKIEYFQTPHGSYVRLSGKHRGRTVVDFDWFEEPDACDGCKVNPYPENIDGTLWLTWSCEHCDGGQAVLAPITEKQYSEASNA